MTTPSSIKDLLGDNAPLSSRARLYPTGYPDPAPSSLAPGAGLGILVNANAKRGGRRVAAQLARVLPGASVRLTRRVEEIDEWLSTLGDMRGLLAAGGDGTAVGLLTALERRRAAGLRTWPVGALPLGTGNAWAHALGARKLASCVRWLAAHQGPLPTRKYTLLQSENTVTFFAGSGWDAQILNDYREQLRDSKGPIRNVNKTAYGYVTAMLSRTVPKALLGGRPRVLVESLGDVVYTLDENAVPVKLEGPNRGRVLYDGPASSAGAATCPEFGFRFRAYPFAERFPGLMNVRVYDQKPLRAVAHIPKLWGGVFPLEGMRDFFCDHVRMTFSRPVPLQIGGEAVGMRSVAEFRVVPEIDVIDWRGL